MTHVLTITNVDHDPEFGHQDDDVAWTALCDNTCNLWWECTECSPPANIDSYESYEAHGDEHEHREGYWAIINQKICAVGQCDGASEAINDAINTQLFRHNRTFVVGETIPFDLDFEGDDYWTVTFTEAAESAAA
ncbi:hypothetical protein [Leifsonia sp. Leaf264]|uniref:hypothetical protein n=1 Tax=Leifsonia sp. Leaf264 TaxID=1736314 RepID=UPI0006F5D449|nr:hypothetical protein [Leifsonia sp. Leaf264]KQO98615.1 hypothetical protein ASF30_11170 [Leifsonia sp. Leaf264]